MMSPHIKVLLIADDEDDYIVVRDLLSAISSIEFILKWVSDYEAALDAILSSEFDVCLLDYRLKERNGLELLQEAVSRSAMTPIVFLTGQGGYDLDLEAMSKGAADWLDKGELSSTILERSIRYAIERQRKGGEMIKAKRVIQALSECNHAVIHIEDEFELLRAICHIVVDVGGYRMAWVGYAEEDPDQTVTPVAKYGYEKDYLGTIKVTWKDAEMGRGPAGTCIRTGVPSIVSSVGNQGEFAPWQVEASKRGYASIIGLPLLLDGRRLGALTIYSSETDAFDSEAAEFLVKLSGNLSYGIGVLRLRKARMQAEESLKEANLDLERRVDERTAELIKVNAELTREVEERRQAEDALRLSERSLSRAELVARFGNWAFILGCDKVEASEGARIIYGLEGSEWSIPKIQRISLPEHRGMLDKALDGLIEEGKPYNVEFKIRRPADGKIIDIHSIAEYSPEKRVVFGVIQDITERKQMEKALFASEERLRTLMNSTPDIVCFKDAEGRWLEANDAELELFDLKGVDYRGKKTEELADFSEFYREALLACEATDELAFQERTLTRGEVIIPRPNGTAMVYDVIKVPLFHPDGRPKWIVVLGRDITDRKNAEVALRESEELYRTLVSLSPDAISVVDLNCLLIVTSPRALQMFGDSSDDEVLGRNILAWVAPEDQGKASANVQQLLTEGTLTDTEYTLIRKDGTRFIGEISAAVIRSPDGIPTSIIIITRDVTERKRAEEVLRESEQRFRSLVENSPFAYQALDIDGCYIDVNQELCDLLGYRPDELLGRSFGDFWPENTRTIFTQAFETFKHDRQVSTELLLMTKDGREINVILEGRIEQDNDGNFLRTHCILTDITSRKLAEIALRQSEERFSRFFRATPVGTSISRVHDGQFADVNDAFLSLFGYTREEVIGQNPLKLKMYANPEDWAKMVEMLQEQGRIQDFETRLVRKSGEIRDASISAEMIELDGQQYALGLTHDITERNRAKTEKEKLEAQLFQAQKMESVGRLAGGVAHDFNNMLGVIIGRAEMALNMDASTDGLQHNLQEILNAGLRSADLTRQLLAFARKQTAVPKILDLNDTISGMLKMLRRLIGEDIDLSWQPGFDLWKVKIDPSQVDQILANLVVNSRDAISGVGAITMITENVVIDDSNRADHLEFIPGEYVLLTVTDTGEGMSQELRENIFEPFFTTKEVGKGTGLGLSTVYGIVKQNDGFIYVASELGKGTTSKIYLPRFEAKTAQVASEEIAGERPTGTETVLLAEDDEAMLNLGKVILEDLGYTVIAAQTPVQAIHLAQDYPGDIHLLITDVVMPEMNGRELAKQLRTSRPNLKCLYMSGYTADVIAHRGILDEGVGFIQKPFLSDDFTEKVRQVLDHVD